MSKQRHYHQHEEAKSQSKHQHADALSMTENINMRKVSKCNVYQFMLACLVLLVSTEHNVQLRLTGTSLVSA